MNGIVVSIIVTMVIQAMVSMAVFTPPVLAPLAAPEIGLSPSAAGLSTALIYGAAAIAALVSGGFIARLGPMRTSQLCLLLVAIGISCMALAHPLAAAFGAVLIGLGYGPVTPSSSAILNERTPPHLRAFIFSVKQTGVPIGGGLAGALVPLLIVAGGWRVAALVVGAVALLLVILVQPGRSAADANRNRSARLGHLRLREPLRLVWGNPDLRRMALASFAYSGMQMCLGSYLVVLLHETAGFSIAAAGAALSVAMAGGILGRIGWGLVADRGVPPRLLLGGLGIAMSVAAFVMPFLGSHWPWPAVLALSFFFGATAVGWNGVHLSEVARIAAPAQAAMATGGSLFMTFSGVVLSPMVIWIVESAGYGYGIGFVLVGLLTLWRASAFFRAGAGGDGIRA
ncbi:MAG: MFS transporter [Burkholderiales bacterium]|nr:MFS transporter [Burkholderiales bacterium]